jgi:hypothetical protein
MSIKNTGKFSEELSHVMGILCFTLGHITIKTWVAGAWKIA